MAVLRSIPHPEACQPHRSFLMPALIQVKHRSNLEENGTEPSNRLKSAASGVRPRRLAILISHPVQYFSPLFRRLAEQPEIDLTVLYCSLQGAGTMNDPGFGVSFAWDIPLLEGYRYKALRNFWPGRLKGFFSCINPGVINELRKGAYDAVIIFGWGNLTNWLAFSGASLADVPWMLYGDTNVLKESGAKGLKPAIRRIFLTSLFRRTSAFLTSGGFNRAFYASMGVPATHCFWAPMVVDNESFAKGSKLAKASRIGVRELYGISPNMTLLLFSGKLVARKRPQDILRALRFLQAEFPLLGCLFAGEGVLRQRLQEETSRHKIANAFFLGFRNQSELPRIYACADCLVLPSVAEPRGVVVNEAMASGLPVIVSDRTGVWGPGDIVRDGENGFVYPCGDIRALAEAIRKLVNDPDLRLRMGKRSFEIIQGFTYEKCAGGILKALDSVVAVRHPQEQ